MMVNAQMREGMQNAHMDDCSFPMVHVVVLHQYTEYQSAR